MSTPTSPIEQTIKEPPRTLPAFAAPVGESEFRRIRRRLSLDLFKWDSQIGDTPTLFPQPLLMPAETWHELTQMSEALAAELRDTEEELAGRPELHALLGMPKQLRSVLRDGARHGLTPTAVRTLRFDFHYSTDGWRISEVNSDVPGGYVEASAFTELMAACVPRTRSAGNPAKEWGDAMASVTGDQGHVALLSAVGFLEDQQVTAFLASELQRRGFQTFLLHHPAQLTWKSGYASTVSKGNQIGIDAIVRFYQGEWLGKSSQNSGWEFLFVRGKTPVTNPASALLTESKRFPLTWKALSNPMITWRSLLPESCNPQDRRWRVEDAWVLKMAYSNTGDEVHIREFMSAEAWDNVRRNVERDPSRWIAQKRFEPVPIDSDAGPVYPCFGVYVINGRAAGAYARVTARHVIDHAAMDAALLIQEGKTLDQR